MSGTIEQYGFCLHEEADRRQVSREAFRCGECGQTIRYDAPPEVLEAWRPVVGFEGRYEVSSMGRVRSLIGRPKFLKARRGRRDVVLCRSATRSSRMVARLVLEAFVRLPSVGEVACCLDGDPFNCRLVNLQWRHHHTTVRRVAAGVGGVLDNDLVDEARSRVIAGDSVAKVAREMNVNQNTLRDAVRGRSWSVHHARVPTRLERFAAGVNDRGKLNTGRVCEIRRLGCSGWSQRAIAEAFGLSSATVFNILHRKSWAHLPLMPGEPYCSGRTALDSHRVQAIRRLHREGESVRALATRFGVDRASIYRILSGKSWAHLPDPENTP